MLNTIQHRGPDNRGIFQEQGILLGHQRLSILDLSPLGHQPMESPNHDLTIVFSGEIYNYIDIQTDLKQKGHSFRSRTDTEVILHAYQEWGETCVNKMEGMFAFAIWDRPRQTLFLARDRMGEKPLYFYADKTSFAFASELQCFSPLHWVPRKLAPASILSYLNLQYIPGPSTILQNLHRLDPAHSLSITICNNSIHTEKRMFWNPASHMIPQTNLSAGDLESQVEEKLRHSIRKRLMADVPVGILLSGGIDSALITALAAQESQKHLSTFSVSFREPRLNEQPYSTRVAGQFSTDHHILSAETLTPSVFQKIIRHMDEPLGDPACLPTYLIAAETSRFVKVVLSGEGADELFGGYPFYSHELLWEHIPPLCKKILARLPHPHGLNPFARRLKRILASPVNIGSARWTQIFDAQDISSYCSSELSNLLFCCNPLKDLQRAYNSVQGSSTVQSMMADLKTWLPDDLLIKVDRMTMAHSVEARTPYLDHTLAETILSLDRKEKVTPWARKIILKRIACRHLPEEIVYRKKHGFEVPLDSWLTTNLRTLADDVFQPDSLRNSGIFAPKQVMSDWEHVKRTGKSRYPRRMWITFILLSWLREHRLTL